MIKKWKHVAKLKFSINNKKNEYAIQYSYLAYGYKTFMKKAGSL